MCVLMAFATKGWLVDRWLSDVELKKRDGTDRPASFFVTAIRGAVASVARTYSLALCPETITDEPKDTVEWSPVGFWLTRLRRRPVVEVTRLSAFNGNVRIYDLPVGRAHVPSPLHAQLQIVQSGDAIQLLNPMTFTDPWPAGPYHPGGLRVSYTAGPESALIGTLSAVSGSAALTGVGTAFTTALRDGDIVQIGAGEARQVSYVVSDTEAVMLEEWGTTASGAGKRARIPGGPDDLLELIGIRAAIAVLNNVGLSRHEPGVSSESVSADGFSESLSYQTQEAGGAYSALVKGYEARAAELHNGLKRTFAVRLGGVL